MYQALYRKYRPQTFDDMVGQPAITVALKNQLINGRMSHAYLFTGSRGTGKTSSAKILAKAVNCENPVDGNPCNCCAACKSIDSGSCMDVLEIDAASNNGVDQVRSLRDDAVYSPAQVRKRVYIIDEVHMLSISAFNALLKIIEEPPEHLLFILATTELHKVPATILSRCQRYSFRRITQEDLAGRLSFIAYRENIDLTADGANYLARLADGGMRDAISLLDQCASSSSGTIDTDQICKVLGYAGTRQTVQMLQAVAARDTKTLLSIFSSEYAQGKDLTAMLDELCTAARDLLILHTSGKDSPLISGICTAKELSTLSKSFSPGELLRITTILRDAAAGFRNSADRRIDAELALIRLCEVEGSLDAADLNARLSRLENKIAQGLVMQALPKEEEPDDDADRPPWEELEKDIPPEAPGQLPPPQAPKEDADSGEFWKNLIPRLRPMLRPPVLGMFSLSEMSPVKGSLQGDLLVLLVRDMPTKNFVDRPQVLQTVAECAAGLLGRPVRVQVKDLSQAGAGNENFDRLMQFGSQHPDLIDFK
ncbi:MAG: DNA polymerase III subunit gamma/tau [Oscillospiraceae bacterium]|nr:DNA polymerase III subunit gamma/tau [Oscillospiraceae bacterium]